jgi:hypothetical protein
MPNIDRRHRLIGLLRQVAKHGAAKSPGAAYKALQLVAYMEGWLPAQEASKSLPLIEDPETAIENMLDDPDPITDLLKSLREPGDGQENPKTP